MPWLASESRSYYRTRGWLLARAAGWPEQQSAGGPQPASMARLPGSSPTSPTADRCVWYVCACRCECAHACEARGPAWPLSPRHVSAVHLSRFRGSVSQWFRACWLPGTLVSAYLCFPQLGSDMHAQRLGLNDYMGTVMLGQQVLHCASVPLPGQGRTVPSESSRHTQVHGPPAHALVQRAVNSENNLCKKSPLSCVIM